MKQQAEKRVIGMLPADARAMLKKAAETHITKADSLARIKAIDRAAAIIKARYPEYFRKE